MGAYILRRLLLIIPTLLGIMIINFTLIQFVPGGPIEQVIARIEGGGDVFETISGGGSELADAVDAEGYAGRTGLSQRLIDQLQVDFNFARIVCDAGYTGNPDLRADECNAVPIPLFERFVLMMWDYVRFDFGESFFHNKTVVELVIEKMPVSITLGLWSTLIAYLVSIPLGIRKAVQDGSRFDTWTSGAIIVGYAIPGFLFAVLLIVLFTGGSFWRLYPLRGLTSNDWETLTWLGRWALYWPYALGALIASVAGGMLALGQPGRMDHKGEAGRYGLGALGALAIAGACIAVIGGSVFGDRYQHLYLVLLPALMAVLTGWLRLRRPGRAVLPTKAILRFLRLALGAVPGVLWGLFIIGMLSVFKLIDGLPGPAENEDFTMFGRVGDYAWHIALPIFASSIAGFATLTLLTKNSFLDEIKKQYVITARAKGLTENRVLYGHVFRNAMLIVISGFPALFISVFFGGSIIIETLFTLDGLGRLGFEATVARNYPVMFGTLFTFSLIGLVVNILTDLTYVLIDPRIDFERR